MGAVQARLGESIRELEQSIAAADTFPLPVLDRQQDRLEESILAAKERIAAAFTEVRDAVERRERELLEMVERASDVRNVTEALWGLRDIDDVARALNSARAGEEAWKGKYNAGTGIDGAGRREMIRLTEEAVSAARKAEERTRKAVDALRCGTVSFKALFEEDIVGAISAYGEVRVTGGGEVKLRCTGIGVNSVNLEWSVEYDDENDDGDDDDNDDNDLYSKLEYRILACSPKSPLEDKVVQEGEGWNGSCKVSGLEGDTEYRFCVQLGVAGCGWGSKSECIAVRTNDPWMWKDCPDGVYDELKYTVGPSNRRIASKSKRDWGTVIGDTLLQEGEATSWSIRILKTRNFPTGIFIGVAPFDINQSYGSYVWNKSGWYLECFHSELCAGPPHSYRQKKYGPRKGDQQHICEGDTVGVVMDVAKGELSFVLNDENLGVAYEGIPTDKPLVPCVLLWDGDSVELLV